MLPRRILFYTIALSLLVGCGVATDSSDYTPPTLPEHLDNNETLPEQPSQTPEDPDSNETDYVFDPDGAIYDPNACDMAKVSALPLTDDIDTSSDKYDYQNGIGLKSLFYGGYTTTYVILYYNKAPTGTLFFNQTTTLYGADNEFYLVFDRIWATFENNIVYIQTPPALESTLPRCYKTVLESVDATQLHFTKVYR